ncbi:MAG: hypothetical protein Q8N47_14905 [Bryobacterales bacterium]|nr:hypothetical protein [Bryobacterales bacterium]
MVTYGELMCMAVAMIAFPVVMMMAAEEGSASGWIEVKGQRVALKYAFAAMTEDVTERGKEKMEVLLSDKPVPMEMRKATNAWEFWVTEQAQKGELHGIIVYLDADTKVWSRSQRLSRNGMEFYSQSVSPPELNDLVFAPAPAGSGEIAGKVSMKKAMRAVMESEGPWQVEADFRTPVVARPSVTGSFTGAAARDSAPYKAVQAHLLACQKKDLEAIRKTMNPNAQGTLAKFEAARGRKAMLDACAEMATETLKMKLTKVTVRGDTAEVEFSGGDETSSSVQTMPVVLDNGVWKIGQ